MPTAAEWFERAGNKGLIPAQFRLGGLYEKAADWASFAIVDDGVITGQNPASSTAAARTLLSVLAERKAA